MRYQVFGMCIDSDTALAGLRPSHGGDVTCPGLRINNAGDLIEVNLSIWTLQCRVTVDPKGKPWLLYAGDDSFLLEYENLLQYKIAVDGTRVDYAVSSQVTQESFQWNLVHLVLPFVLHLRGVPVYHAGAANTQEGSLLFFGHSGQGKSTLSASFGKAGYPVVTDDVLVLQEQRGQFFTVPSLPWVRLGAQSFDAVFGGHVDAPVVEDGDGKMRVDAATGLLPFATEPSPVRAIYVLNSEVQCQGDSLVAIQPISPAEAIGILLSRDIMLPILSKGQLNNLLEFLTKLVRQTPVWQLTITRDLARLQDVVSEIVQLPLGEQSPPAVPIRGGR